MLPENASGIGTLSGAAPQIVLTPWFRNRMMPKVARICDEMVAAVEAAEDQNFERKPEGERGRQRQREGAPEPAGRGEANMAAR